MNASHPARAMVRSTWRDVGCSSIFTTMTNLNLAATLLGLAAAGGITMLAIRLRGAPQPPTWLALGHGLAALAGLVTLIYAVATATSIDPLVGWSLAVLCLAAAGGATIFVGFHLPGRPLPIPLIFAHGLLAATGWGLLLFAIFA
jgi:hypothetical protein